MTCALEPARICACCEAGKPCAHRLMLTSRQQTQLAWITSIAGECEGRAVLGGRPMGTRTAEFQDEPTTELQCAKCDAPLLLYGYLAAFVERYEVRVLCRECLG